MATCTRIVPPVAKAAALKGREEAYIEALYTNAHGRHISHTSAIRRELGWTTNVRASVVDDRQGSPDPTPHAIVNQQISEDNSHHRSWIVHIAQLVWVGKRIGWKVDAIARVAADRNTIQYNIAKPVLYGVGLCGQQARMNCAREPITRARRVWSHQNRYLRARTPQSVPYRTVPYSTVQYSTVPYLPAVQFPMCFETSSSAPSNQPPRSRSCCSCTCRRRSHPAQRHAPISSMSSR